MKPQRVVRIGRVKERTGTTPPADQGNRPSGPTTGAMEIIDAFSKHQAARNLSRATINRRRVSLTALARFAAPATLLEVSPELIEDWLGTYRSPETAHAYLADVKALFRWARRRDLVERDPTDRVDGVHRPRALPRPISEDNLARSLAAADDKLRLVLLLGDLAGLRRAEIAQLRGEDCTAESIVVRNGKGGKSRVVPMHPVLWLLIRSWGAGRGYLFANGRNHVAPGTVGRWVREHHQRLDIDDRLHSTRHRYGTELAKIAKGDLLSVAELMGHARVSTTQGYVAFDTSRLAELIEKLRPAA